MLNINIVITMQAMVFPFLPFNNNLPNLSFRRMKLVTLFWQIANLILLSLIKESSLMNAPTSGWRKSNSHNDQKSMLHCLLTWFITNSYRPVTQLFKNFIKELDPFFLYMHTHYDSELK